MKNKRRIAISVLLIVLITAGAYLFENIAKKQGVNSAKIIKITKENKVVAFISSDVLKQLMEQSKQQDEDNISGGPSLLLTMDAAGASNFKQIEVKGKGKNSSIILDKKDLNDDLEMFLNNDGTINLCKKGNSSNFIVKEINEISIEK